MPNKSVPGWTQVPVAAADLVEIKYARTAPGSATCSASVTYEVKDDQGAVRFRAEYATTGVTYPVSLAAILSAINTAQGT